MARDRNSYQQYWQELAAKSGLSKEQIAKVSEVLGDEAAGKVFVEGFVAQSDYSRDLDRTRDEWKTKADEAAATKARYDEWYKDKAVPAYERHVAAVGELQKYRDLYGALDVAGVDGNRGGGNGNNPGYLTKADLDKILQERSTQDGVVYSSIVKDAAAITADYVTRFPGKPPLDWDELEKLVAKEGIKPKDAYKRMIEPFVEEQRKLAEDQRVEARVQERMKELQSTHQFPADSRPRGFHNLYDQGKPDEKLSEGEREAMQRREFAEDYEAATGAK